MLFGKLLDLIHGKRLVRTRAFRLLGSQREREREREREGGRWKIVAMSETRPPTQELPGGFRIPHDERGGSHIEVTKIGSPNIFHQGLSKQHS